MTLPVKLHIKHLVKPLGYINRIAVAVGNLLMTLMFTAFILQIVSRYVFNSPFGWTLEACLLAWVWIVFWGGAFLLSNNDHVRFDILYVNARPSVRRFLAALSAIGIIIAFGYSFLPTQDFVSFMAIEKSSLLKIRFDYVFSVFLIFSASVIARYTARLFAIVIRKDFEDDPVDPAKELT